MTTSIRNQTQASKIQRFKNSLVLYYLNVPAVERAENIVSSILESFVDFALLKMCHIHI